MKKTAPIMAALGAGLVALAAAGFAWPRMQVPEPPKVKAFHQFQETDIDGKVRRFKSFKGRAYLVVNVASKCGNTPQYEGLEALYSKYKDKGLVVMGFPANDFAGQEPGSNADIKQFCTSTYKVTFPMFSKITVVGDKMSPLYAWLISKTDGRPIDWNFAKFLVAKDGAEVTRFSARTQPNDPKVIAAVEAALGLAKTAKAGS